MLGTGYDDNIFLVNMITMWVNWKPKGGKYCFKLSSMSNNIWTVASILLNSYEIREGVEMVKKESGIRKF